MLERGLAPDRFAGDDVVTGDMVVAAPAPEPASTPEPAPSRQDTMRRHIADLMARSWREIPHYHLTQRLDLTLAMERLTATNESRALADRIVPGALLLCAAARAAAKVPQCNGWWHGGRFEQSDTVDLGLVLSLRTGGIIVPTIQRANELSPIEMMRRMTDLVQQARQGRLRSSHLGEASITVTSLGDRGADSVIGVIHPPQVALVGFGAVRDALWPANGTAVVRPTVHASLAGDHRATDGLIGSRFLAQMQALLDGAIPAELDDAESGQEVS
jgi:pyruvate dehydrogenase E2 component (dihydrolipoamide acetyltransferase)